MMITSFLLGVLAAAAPTTQAASPSLLSRLSAAAPNANPKVIELALQAHECAIGTGVAPRASRLAVVDYSLPSTTKRMWVFDLARQTLMYNELVAHGQGTGDNLARNFSNKDGSHQTSLGLFTTAETYVGGNGYSMRMDGLEKGVNDNARARAIVMHGAPYVDASRIKTQGRIGRSWGCPALRPEVAREVIDNLKQGQMLFAYYPDKNWLANSPFLTCKTRTAAAATRATTTTRPTVARTETARGTAVGGGIGAGISARPR